MGWRIASVFFGIAALIAWGAAFGIAGNYLEEAGWAVGNGEAWFNAIFLTFMAGGFGVKANKPAEHQTLADVDDDRR